MKDMRFILASYIKICNQSDPNLGNCIRSSIVSLRPKLQDGIPELEIPSLEPLFIPEIVIDQIDGVQIHATFKNLTVAGLSKFRLRSFKTDKNAEKLLCKLWFPQLLIKGFYEIRGQLLMMAVNGKQK